MSSNQHPITSPDMHQDFASGAMCGTNVAVGVQQDISSGDSNATTSALVKAKPPFYTPNNFDELIESKAKGSAWLDSHLAQEIELSKPNTNDIGEDGQRNVERIAEECGNFFFPDREFCCKSQLHAMLDSFATNWAFSVATGGSKLKCSFAPPDKPSASGAKSNVSPKKRRKITISLKQNMQCPFAINYAILYRYSPNGMPSSKLPVKVTSVNFNHTCNPAPAIHRLSMKKNGKLQPDMNSVQEILELLKFGDIPNRQLRQLLQNRLPVQHTALDAHFLCNFKQRAMVHTLDPNRKWKSDEVRALLDGRHLPADEGTKFDSDITLVNYREHLTNVMQDTGQMWDVMKLFQNIGVDYRVSSDKETGRPNGVVWMTNEMKTRLIRYGRSLFLDFQKRQFNKVNWPYCGPVVIDCDKQICVVAESIFVSECLDGYEFALSSMFQMTPQFQKSNIALIFSDEFLTDDLLVRLEIQETAILRCDQWHLLHEVWPKYFGRHWQDVENKLRAMIEGKTKAIFDEAFASACEAVKAYPNFIDYIRKFHENPKKYAAYTLAMVEGNLDRCGSTPAEQNHASIVSFIGKGASLALPEQITKLLERQQDLARKKSRAQLEYSVHCSCYHSTFDTPKDSYADMLAKKHLSEWAYINLWLKAQKGAKYLETKQTENGTLVKAIGEIWESNTVILIPKGGRCPCHKRISHQFQCKEEYIVDGCFLLEKYNGRWLHPEVFRIEQSKKEAHDEISVGSVDDIIDQQQAHITEQENNSEEQVMEIGMNKLSSENQAQTIPQQDIFLPTTRKQANSSVTYRDVKAVANELADTTSNNGEQRAYACCFMKSLIQLFRTGDTNAVTKSMVEYISKIGQEFCRVQRGHIFNDVNGNALLSPLRGGDTSSTAKNKCRIRSAMEYSSKNNTKTTANATKRAKVSEAETLAIGSRSTKTCSFCGACGHQITHCPEQRRYGILLTFTEKKRFFSQCFEPFPLCNQKKKWKDT